MDPESKPYFAITAPAPEGNLITDPPAPQHWLLIVSGIMSNFFLLQEGNEKIVLVSLSTSTLDVLSTLCDR